jgi:serine/threonine protein kinase
MALSKGYKLGPYEIESLVGAGGMGEVYRAKDTRLDRIVAIKVLPKQLTISNEARARFDREAKIISSLNHHNICTLHDVGTQDGIDYLVMEFLEGESLENRLKKGKLEQAEALDIAVQIANALDTAHSKGLVHRDLKPGNILLTKDGAKLLDFGLAKLQHEVVGGMGDETEVTPVTGAGTIVGTLQYMSPEQLESRDADTRSDIFSFGATLYEMLTGQRAFTGDSKASLIGSIMKEVPQPISDVQPTLPPVLDRLIRKCLEKDPNSRWQNAKDLQEILIWVTSSDLNLNTSPTVSRKVKILTRVSFVLLVVVTFISTIMWIQSDNKVEQAELSYDKAKRGQKFLSDVLTSSFPYGYGDGTTVLDIIERASEKLNEAFLDEPEIEGELRFSLGNAFSRVGHYREARREITSSLALYEKAYGISDDKTLEVLLRLFRINRIIGDTNALLSTARKYEDAIEKRFGNSHKETFWAKEHVAYALEGRGEIDKAVQKIEESWMGFKNDIKIDTLSTLYAQVQYAWLLLKQGQELKSKELSIEAYNLAKSINSEIVRDSKSVLAATHIVLGEIDSAITLYENHKIPESFGIDHTFQGKFDLGNNQQFQLLVFFETWCPFSRQAMKKLGKIDRQYNQFGLDIYGMTRINRSAKDENVTEYLKDLDVKFTVVKENGRSWNYFNCDGTPSIRLVHKGYLIWEQGYYTSDPISTQMLESIASL